MIARNECIMTSPQPSSPFPWSQDMKPFKVRIVSPPPVTELKKDYHFHPRTHNGDKIMIDDKEFIVSKVSRTNVLERGANGFISRDLVEVLAVPSLLVITECSRVWSGLVCKRHHQAPSSSAILRQIARRQHLLFERSGYRRCK